MPYIHFTADQKRRVAEADLEQFLLRQGETLLRSGPEWRLASDHSVTVRGSQWYDHAAQQGGGPVSFPQRFHGLSYPEAVTCLLEEIPEGSLALAQTKKEKPKKKFALPPAASNMRRVFAYLVGTRCASREALVAFVRAGLVYESAGHHNAVFVGTDERGIARHAHVRSTNGRGKAFRLNVEGGDSQYSFHWTGTDGNLYVFESPIDLLSYITLYPADWQRRSYVACCGTSGLPVVRMLDDHPNLRRVWLCLDNDRAGHAASQRMAEQFRERGIITERLTPERKDWNDDLVVASQGGEAL